VHGHHIYVAGGFVNGAAIIGYFSGHLPEWAAVLAIAASAAQLFRFCFDTYDWWTYWRKGGKPH
jgi:hypothetical protein